MRNFRTRFQTGGAAFDPSKGINRGNAKGAKEISRARFARRRTGFTCPGFGISRGRAVLGRELLLHIILRQEFGTIPAISKFFYKDTPNDTVKGFDSVHVVGTKTQLELWLGEVKFYSSLRRAARDVCAELRAHSQRNYLRTEFAAITNKLDETLPFYKKLKKLLDPNTSLDQVFDAVVIPVLLTYKSRAVRGHNSVNARFKEALLAEVLSQYEFFRGLPPPKKLKIHLILLPMASKSRLINSFDEALRTWQKIA